MDLVEKTSNVNRHPWELSRTQCLLNILKKNIINDVADIGAGDRFFTSKLLPFVSGTIYAIDTGYNEVSKIIDGIHCFNDISKLPKLNCDGTILFMDVLEHIQNDTAFLNDVLDKMPAGGFVLITVPAFQFLFSEHDKFVKHSRRYNKKRLLALLNSQHLNVEKIHYFYTSLFFVRMVSFLFKKIKPAAVGNWNFSDKHIITRLIYAILNIDFRICAFFAKFNIYLPGLSLLAICKLRAREA
ncbi:MAG: class I SAM-dependent methyltransferase [Fibromonadaceae bacterium]|jgi:hypothetical protein|nr:class I SAM-dependent methyltransferase [Fibromonadaceae bacterium]